MNKIILGNCSKTVVEMGYVRIQNGFFCFYLSPKGNARRFVDEPTFWRQYYAMRDDRNVDPVTEWIEGNPNHSKDTERAPIRHRVKRYLYAHPRSAHDASPRNSGSALIRTSLSEGRAFTLSF